MPQVEMWGFAAPWDPRSDSSAAAHSSALSALVSGFIILDSASLKPIAPYIDVVGSAASPLVRRMAIVSSFHGSRFHPETIRALASDSTALGGSAGQTASMLERAGYRGAVFDFEGLTSSDYEAMMRVTHGFADSARAHGISTVAMAIPASDTAAYPARDILSAVDLVVVMLYDQHWSTSPPGAIAAPDWAMRALGLRVGDVGASRVVAALPVYGYQWRADSAARVVSFTEAERIARDAGLALTRDPSSSTLHAESREWSIWVSDATLVDSLVRGARSKGVTRFALWRLGLEDPRFWNR